MELCSTPFFIRIISSAFSTSERTTKKGPIFLMEGKKISPLKMVPPKSLNLFESFLGWCVRDRFPYTSKNDFFYFWVVTVILFSRKDITKNRLSSFPSLFAEEKAVNPWHLWSREKREKWSEGISAGSHPLFISFILHTKKGRRMRYPQVNKTERCRGWWMGLAHQDRVSTLVLLLDPLFRCVIFRFQQM